MAGPSQLCHGKEGGDAGQTGPDEDFSVRKSVAYKVAYIGYIACVEPTQ